MERQLEEGATDFKQQFLVIRTGGNTTWQSQVIECVKVELCQACGKGVCSSNRFICCIECGVPFCRECQEKEKEKYFGNRSCPQCNSRHMIRPIPIGVPLVDGDIGEDRIDIDININEEEHYPLSTKQPQQTHPFAADDIEFIVSPEILHGRPQHHSIPSTSSEPLESYDKFLTFDDPIESPVQVKVRTVDPSKGLDSYGVRNIDWGDRVREWKFNSLKEMMKMSTAIDQENGGGDYGDNLNIEERQEMYDDGIQPLHKVVPIPTVELYIYRAAIIMRLIIVVIFFHYRVTTPVKDAYPLWLISVICEIWFGLSWILDQFPKWTPINRETYLNRLELRYGSELGSSMLLPPIDVFVSTVDPLKEPPLITVNTVLSVLAVDYPVDKVSCYVSDDGAAMLTFEALSETAQFARKWVPFCKKHDIEPRAPEFYFAQKIDYLKDKTRPSLVKERRAMKREYEEFRVKINALVENARKMPEEGWTMDDGTPWPGNKTRDHPAMIQVFLGHTGVCDIEGNELPRLVYISREKRHGFQHHKKAGAMNALIRVSAVLTNGAYILNVDCDHYFNNSKALREAMCFMMDHSLEKKICYVQFPQRFDGIDFHDRYANRNTVFFDVNLKGLDGIQGPVYVGTGCCFNRQALYGHDPVLTDENSEPNTVGRILCGSRKKSYHFHDQTQQLHRNEDYIEDVEEIFDEFEDNEYQAVSPRRLEKTFGQSAIFIESTFMEEGGIPPCVDSGYLLKEAIHVISCGYEAKSEWGKEIGWIYGSVTEDILTGFKMHARGWKSIYCMPDRPAFKGSAPINLSDRLNQVLRWALGSIEILLSRHCPIWYGYTGRLKFLQRVAYINTTIYPLTSIPLVAYCILPAICLLTGKFIVPEVSNYAGLWFLLLFSSIILSGVSELRWSGVGIQDWWRNEQFWVIGGTSAHLFAMFQGLLKVFAGIDTNFTVTSKASNEEGEFAELYEFKWTTLLIPPTTILVVNMVGIVAGVSYAINSGYQAWGPLFGKLFFAIWVIVHLYPFLKGLIGRTNRIPTIVIVWSVLLASIFSLLWVHIDPFASPLQKADVTTNCGFEC